MEGPIFCATKNMSWDAVSYFCGRYGLTFDELPVSGPKFDQELKDILTRRS